MLLITFNIGDDRYAIDTQNMIEVVPQVDLKILPMEESYIAGVFSYHGKSVPVIDIGVLCRDHVSNPTLTTRIILIRLDENHIIGILADNLTQTLRISPDKFSSCGIQRLEAEFLGDVAQHEEGMIQLVNIGQLLGRELKARLYDSVGAANAAE
jgi:chemotaxis-related protein WspB